jgi:hypothetical protein
MGEERGHSPNIWRNGRTHVEECEKGARD